jgi:hypothetical protein
VTSAPATGKQPDALLRRLVAHSRVPAGIVALAGLLLSALVHVASMRGVDVESTWPNVWLLHYALFPIVLLAVLTGSAAAGYKRLGLSDFLALVPPWALALLAAALLYALAGLLVFAPSSGAGDPVIENGRYFFNDHGVMREVGEAEFHSRRSVSLRLYSSVWLYLYLFAVVYLFNAPSAAGNAKARR